LLAMAEIAPVRADRGHLRAGARRHALPAGPVASLRVGPQARAAIAVVHVDAGARIIIIVVPAVVRRSVAVAAIIRRAVAVTAVAGAVIAAVAGAVIGRAV